MFAASARADNLNPRAFTETVANATRMAIPSAKVTVTGDLELQIEYGASGPTATMSLANAYDLYLLDPQAIKQVIKNYIDAIAPLGKSKLEKIDRSRIVPVVKNRQWFDYVQHLFSAQSKQLQYSEGPFTGELIVVYVEDNSSTMRFVTTADDVGNRGQVNELALANLMRLLPKIEMRAGADQTWLISAGGDYESSLLLMNDLWTSGQIKVDGELVVAVPAKDALLVTGSRNAAGIALLRKFAAEVATGAYGLTKKLFVYRGGKFVILDSD
jgi:uncharacterized protein YtpQ (UPF0354 family)